MIKWVPIPDSSEICWILKSIRVVECPEFRDICMLLRESLADKDIPRRDKVREAILDQYSKQFDGLINELSVRCKINSIKKMLILLIVAGLRRTH